MTSWEGGGEWKKLTKKTTETVNMIVGKCFCNPTKQLLDALSQLNIHIQCPSLGGLPRSLFTVGVTKKLKFWKFFKHISASLYFMKYFFIGKSYQVFAVDITILSIEVLVALRMRFKVPICRRFGLVIWRFLTIFKLPIVVQAFIQGHRFFYKI